MLNGRSAREENEQGHPAVHVAAAHGCARSLKTLLSSSSPSSRNLLYQGMTPMMFAAANGHRLCVQLLVKLQADLHCMDSKGRMAIDLATKRRHDDIVEFLEKAQNSTRAESDYEDRNDVVEEKEDEAVKKCHRFTLSVIVDRGSVGQVIGEKGYNLAYIRRQTSVSIELLHDKDGTISAEGALEVPLITVRIVGQTTACVLEARALLYSAEHGGFVKRFASSTEAKHACPQACLDAIDRDTGTFLNHNTPDGWCWVVVTMAQVDGDIDGAVSRVGMLVHTRFRQPVVPMPRKDEKGKWLEKRKNLNGDQRLAVVSKATFRRVCHICTKATGCRKEFLLGETQHIHEQSEAHQNNMYRLQRQQELVKQQKRKQL